MNCCTDEMGSLLLKSPASRIFCNHFTMKCIYFSLKPSCTKLLAACLSLQTVPKTPNLRDTVIFRK